jgi:regulatory protein
VSIERATAPADRESRTARALELAYRYLARRERTCAQVVAHLQGRGIEPAAIEAAVAELCEQRYLDDARFARTFAEDRRSLDDWGAERIERALVAAGVDRELAAQAAGERDAAGELEAALALLRRRIRDVPASDRERERALAMLVRKGYELELAYDAVRAFAREG